MRKKLLLLSVVLSVLLCFSLVFSVEAASMWSRTYGTGNAWACSMVATSDGGYAIVGVVDYDIWLVKTDAFGDLEWDRIYVGAGGQWASSLAATSDGGYAIAGYTYVYGAGLTDFWLVKTDSLGNMQWNKTYGGTGNEMAYSLVATSDGGYAIAGSTWNMLDFFGAGSPDFWLVKTDEFGIYPEYSSLLAPALVLTATAFIIINKKRLIRTR